MNVKASIKLTFNNFQTDNLVFWVVVSVDDAVEEVDNGGLEESLFVLVCLEGSFEFEVKEGEFLVCKLLKTLLTISKVDFGISVLFVSTFNVLRALPNDWEILIYYFFNISAMF